MKKRKVPRRWWFRGLNVLFVLSLVLSFAAVVGTFFVFNSGDNSEWLRVEIEKQINDRAKGQLTATLGSATLSVGKGQGARLVLKDFKVSDKKGRLDFKGQALEIVPNWFRLIKGTVEVRSVTLREGALETQVMPADASSVKSQSEAKELLLSEIAGREEKNFFSGERVDPLDSIESTFLDLIPNRKTVVIKKNQPSVVGPYEEAEILKLVANALNQAGLGLDKVAELGLGAIQLEDIDVVLTKPAGDVDRTFRVVRASFDESRDETGDRRQRIEIDTFQRGAKGVELALTHIKNSKTNQRAFLFEISNFIARNFVKRLNRPGYPIKIETPFFSNGQIVLDEDKKIRVFEMAAHMGKGTITTGEKSTMPVDSGTLNLALNRREQTIIVKPSPFVFAKSRVTTEGVINLPVKLSDPYFFNFEAKDSYFDANDVPSAPVLVETLASQGALQPRQKLVSVSNFTLKSQDTFFKAAVSFGFDGVTPSMALAARSGPVDVDKLKQLWPIFIAPSARNWTINNLHEGQITGGTIDAAVPNDILGRFRLGAFVEDDQLQLDFEMINASFNTFGDFPKVDDARIVGQTRGITFTAEVNGGEAQSALGGNVSLQKGRFHIPDFRFPGPTADITFEVNGEAEHIGSIANEKPVQALSYAEIKPEGLTGAVFANVGLTVPLRSDITADDVKWRADLDLDDFSSPGPIEGRKIEKADARIELVPEQMTIKGKGTIDGIEADIDLERSLKEGADNNVAVKVTLNDEDRKKLGIDLGDYLIGPVDVAITQKAGESAKGDFYKIDLSLAEIRLDFLGWRKARGIPAVAEMRFTTTSKGTLVRDFILKGDGFGAQGEIDLTSTGEIKRLRLTKFGLREGDQLQVEAFLRAERTYEIFVDGPSFDARSLIRVLTQDPNDAADDAYRYKIKASIGTVIGALKEEIRGLSLDVSLRGATVLRLAVEGLTKNAPRPFVIQYGSQNKRGDILTASGPDGGAIARFANIYFRAFGGEFNLRGQRAPGATEMRGNFNMVNFRLIDEPALKGLGGGRDVRGRSSVLFNILDIEFSEENQRLTMTKGLLSGDNIGGTYEGVLNRKTKQLDFVGTYVPAYVLNNFFTKIPIVGPVLGNGNREGLIGVTFKVVGTLARPQVTVNPLSALAPGFLRQLFQFRKDQKETN